MIGFIITCMKDIREDLELRHHMKLEAVSYTHLSNYNQLPKPAVVFTYQGKSKLVIRRQTFDDLTYYDTNEDYE